MKKRILSIAIALCLLFAYMPVLEAAGAETFTAYIVDAELRIYQSPSTSSAYVTRYFGESYVCDAVQGDWARLVNGSVYGFCALSGISSENPNKYSIRMYVNTDGVPVYTLPTTGSRVMMRLSKNESYTAVGFTRNGAWTHLINGSYHGYVESRYLSTSPVGQKQYVYVTDTLLNVYASASESAAVSGVISYGESYLSDATQGDWCRIEYGGGYGFCKISGLSVTDPNTLSNTVYINTDNVPVYRKPSAGSGVMMYVSKNAAYTARAVTPDGAWYRLQNGSAFGYVESRFITNSPSGGGDSYPVYIISNTLPAYAATDTSSAVLGVMTYGEKYLCTAISGQWAQIQNDGKTGYCLIGGISTQDPNTLNTNIYINTDNVPVYRKASTDSGVMMRLSKNSCYVARAHTADGAWYRLQNGSYFGYVESRYISASPTGDSLTVYIAANTLPAYSDPSEYASVLGVMSYGESMIQLAQSGNWSMIQNGSGDIGYCLTSGLSVENPNKYSQTIYVRQSGAVLYSKPNYNYATNVATRVNDAYTAVAITQDNAWVRLIYNGGYAYIESKYITNVPQTQDTVTMYVNDNTLTVYQSPSAESAVLGVMSYSDALKVHAVQDGWAKVENASGNIGYCRYGSLTETNPQMYSVPVYIYSDSAPIRSRPVADSAYIIATKPRGTLVTALAVTNDQAWMLVDYGSNRGFIAVSDLSLEKPSEDEGSIRSVDPFTVYILDNLAGCFASSDLNSEVLGVMSYGESYTCIGYGDGWAKIRNASGAVGYCPISALTTENPNQSAITVYPQVSGVTVYTKPTQSASVLGTLQINTAVNAIAITQDDEWLRLQNGSAIGYAEAKYFSTTPVNNGASGKAAAVVELAQQQLGKPYVYAEKGPNKFDCSGLTYYVFRNAVGITLQRTAYAQGYDNSYPKISSITDLQIGDLVFFDTSRDSDLCDHVGIYIGGGQFIHASSAGGKVMISSLLNNSYYARTFSWGRRVL